MVSKRASWRGVALVLCMAILFAACQPVPHYQKHEAIPHNAWDYNFKPSFTFDITDSNSVYQPYFIIRHTQAYPYNNLWMWLYIKTPGDTVATKARINIVLADAGGKWLGRGMGEIYEQRMPFSLGDSVDLSRPGTYTIALEQNMRINPLPEILHIGVRVEKVAPRGMRY
ncbi:gliding motility lipoprotein GldH [Nemorincola caseinilytica]